MSVRSISFAALAWMAVSIGTSVGVAHAENYKVQFVRPYKVGYEYNTEIAVSVKREGGSNPRTYKGELYGTVKVLAVNEKMGGVIELQCTVAKLTQDGNDLYPGGVVIVAKKADHVETITVNGQSATPEAVALLRPMFSLSDPGATISDDQAIGTDQPQAVDAAWPVNKQLLARQLVDDGLHVGAAGVKGESKIVRIRNGAGTSMMVVRTAATCNLLPHRNPGKVPILGGELKMSQEVVLPIDTAQPQISSIVDVQMSEIELTRTGQATLTETLHLTRSDQPR